MAHLIEQTRQTQDHLHVWHGCSRDAADRIIRDGVRLYKTSHGHSFAAVDDPDDAEGDVVLEFRVSPDANILDLDHATDAARWKDVRHPLADGVDGITSFKTGVFRFYNRNAISFRRVYSGVVYDPLEETDTHQLDEYALGGLARCTAVTVNAILDHFHKPKITLNDVPIDQPGVMRILTARGLSYKPYPREIGRSLQQFGGLHGRGTWCLITQGHAMALVDGELFDAENKSFDGRKLIAVYEMMRR